MAVREPNVFGLLLAGDKERAECFAPSPFWRAPAPVLAISLLLVTKSPGHTREAWSHLLGKGFPTATTKAMAWSLEWERLMANSTSPISWAR